ncbi:MAG: fatty acid desaturase [bacterium]|nr:fatty acid desaturase [bacterium]
MEIQEQLSGQQYPRLETPVTGKTLRPTGLTEVLKIIPKNCYDNPTARGVAWIVRDFAIFAAATFGLVQAEGFWLVPLWLLAGLSISSLFILGHDAAHDTLFKSKKLNYVLGQLAMLPCFHLYEAWAFGHNRIHHGHTTREVLDYVWHPLSPEQFEALTPLQRLGHRVKWSAFGAGLYYAHEIWWNKMIRFVPNQKLAPAIRRDRIVVGTWAILVNSAVLALGVYMYGGAAGAAWMWFKVMAVPFVIWNYIVGGAVYIHHIAPDITWRQRRTWNKFQGQVEGTTILYMPAAINFFVHNIFLHVAHHVDMRIPFYHLPEANAAIIAGFGDSVRHRKWSFSDYLRSTRECKLFDFKEGRWHTYGTASDTIAEARGRSAAA